MKIINNTIFITITNIFVILGFFPSVYSASAAPIDQIYAVVNQDPITKKEFDDKLDMISSQYIAFGKSIPPKKQLIKEVLSKLIDDSLQLQLAEQNNLTASDPEVKEAIAGIAYRNKMSYSGLKNSIIKSGQDFNNYKAEIKKELIISKLQQQVIKPVQITEQQVNDYLKTHGNLDKTISYRLEDIRVSLPEEPTDDDIVAAKTIAKTIIKSISKNKNIRKIIDNINSNKYPIVIIDRGFQTQAEMPTPFAKVIKKIKKGSLSTPIETPNGIHLLHLIETKDIEPTSFVNQLHVFHILIKPDTIGGSMEESKKEADKIYKEIQSGQNFYEVAKKKSHDSVSAPKGGELGWNTTDELPPQLALAVSELKINQVSKPVESPIGWHLLMIKETKKLDITKNIERQQAMQYLNQKEHYDQLEKWLSQLRYGAYIKILKEDLREIYY